MAINFPNSPSVNDIHSEGGVRWKWNGSSWTRASSGPAITDTITTSNDNSTTTLYPVFTSGTGSQTPKVATTATKNISFDASDGNLTVGGNISAGGTITYDDVTSVDSVGIVTAREDLKVLRNFSTVGLSTFTGAIDANGTLDVAGALYCGGNINQSAGTFITQPGAGNAGIGTATTAHRLDVNGNIQAQGGNPSLYLKSNLKLKSF